MIHFFRIILLFTLMLSCFLGVAQTEGQITKYMFSGVVMNPAQAGAQNAFNAQVFSRFQWIGIEGAPMTQTFAIDGILPKNDKMGLGMHGFFDQIGAQTSVSLYADYAYRLILNDLEDRLAFGISGGVTQLATKGFNTSEVDINGNPIYQGGDDLINQIDLAKWIPDFGLGIYYDREKFFSGLSLINAGGFFSDYKTPTAQLYIGGYFDVSPNTTLKPSLLIKKSFDKVPTVSDFHLSALILKRVMVGGSYRIGLPFSSNLAMQQGIALMAQVYLIEKLRIGYSYDFLIGRTAKWLQGSHEISLGFTMNRTLNRKRSPRMF